VREDVTAEYHRELRVADQSDQQLLTRLQRGDRQAIEYLVGRYQTPLFNFALRFLNDADAAADIVQHAFIQLFTHCQDLHGDEALRPWLFRVARHRCLDEVRRQRTTAFSQLGGVNDSDEPSPLEMIADATPLPDDLVVRDDLQQILQEAINALPVKYREVVTLRYVGDLSFVEIGQVLGLPEATAKTHFHRAKPLLRAFLRERGIINAT
jgi:RNA polymerase sigma-70 factor (ECF subfamily)